MRERDEFAFGEGSESRLITVTDYLQMTARRVIKSSRIDISVPYLGGRRNCEEQNDAFNRNASKADGIIKKSRHQILDKYGKAKALDLVAYIKGFGLSYESLGRAGMIGAMMLEAWEELQDEGLIPKDLYLHWGGFWNNEKDDELGWDPWHFEERDYPQVIRI